MARAAMKPLDKIALGGLGAGAAVGALLYFVVGIPWIGSAIIGAVIAGAVIGQVRKWVAETRIIDRDVERR